MITLYSGNPRSGKSLHLAQTALWWLKTGHNVISNFEINEEMLMVNKISFHIKRPFIRIEKVRSSKVGKFIYLENQEMQVDYFIKFDKENHKRRVEDQTLICIDESQLKFNCREYGMKGRMEWVNFFLQHGKIGYYIILVASFDRLIDRQIRSLVEYQIKHRCVNNYKFGRFFPLKTFVAIQYWYGTKDKVCTDFFVFKNKDKKIYDSYKMFNFAIEKK